MSHARTVENLAVRMLNIELRPFLAKWHPRLLEFERAHEDGGVWADEARCREELRGVQERIRVYALGFAQLAGVHNVEAMLAPGDK